MMSFYHMLPLARARVSHEICNRTIHATLPAANGALWQGRKMLRIVGAFFCVVALFAQTSIAIADESGPELAPTPPMGWANWNSLGCNYDENSIKAIADSMVSSGLRDAGYRYLIIQECIVPFGHRSADGMLIPDPVKFPNGIPALVDYIDQKGLKAGIYTDLGPKTCAGFEGSFQHEQLDAQTFASWGIDLIEEDFCWKPKGYTAQGTLHPDARCDRKDKSPNSLLHLRLGK